MPGRSPDRIIIYKKRMYRIISVSIVTASDAFELPRMGMLEPPGVGVLEFPRPRHVLVPQAAAETDVVPNRTAIRLEQHRQCRDIRENRLAPAVVLNRRPEVAELNSGHLEHADQFRLHDR